VGVSSDSDSVVDSKSLVPRKEHEGMNCLLQEPKCCCYTGCGRLPPRERLATSVHRQPFTAARQSGQSSSRNTRRLCCRVTSTSEPSTSVSTSSPTYSPHQKGLPQSQVWELDFCSRPLLDERGKKRWELLICSPDRKFEYSAYFPNNKINSTQVPELNIHAQHHSMRCAGTCMFKHHLRVLFFS